MKKKAKAKRSFRIRAHKFVTALESNKKASTNLRILQGYVGKATKVGYVRLYLDAELRRFVDVPMDGIEHYEDQRTTTAPNERVILWVNERSAMRHFGNWIANDDPTTMATGEEGGGDPTTMATGEESAGLPNPLDALINPFGSFNRY